MSEHLYSDIQTYRILGIILIVVATAYSLLRLTKVIRWRDQVRRNSGLIRLALFPILAIGLHTYVILPQTRQLQRLKDYGVETRGITEGKIRKGKNTEILFRYQINGTSYQGHMNRKNGPWKHFSDIRETGGLYVVVYDPEQPQNALMDFDRPLP